MTRRKTPMPANDPFLVLGLRSGFLTEDIDAYLAAGGSLMDLILTERGLVGVMPRSESESP